MKPNYFYCLDVTGRSCKETVQRVDIAGFLETALFWQLSDNYYGIIMLINDNL
jgi:hypothetical protein